MSYSPVDEQTELRFIRVRNEDLDNKAQSIVAALTGNASFATTTPPLATISASLTAFQAALALPSGVARNAQVASTRASLTGQLEQLARNLKMTPSVTDAMLAPTGFDMRQPISRTGAPVDAPRNVRLKTTGTTGEVQVLCESVNRAKSYQVRFTEDPNTGTSSDGGMIIQGLERGRDYRARGRAVGPDEPGPWSHPPPSW